MLKARIAIALAISCLSLAALGQDQGVQRACRPDTQKFCSQVAGGDGDQATDCLIDHQKDISDACYSSLKASLTHSNSNQSGSVQTSSSNQSGSSQQQVSAASCKTDMSQFCNEVKGGEGRIKACLIDHQKQISDGCYAFLKKQQSGGSASQSVEPARTVYRSQLASGRIVYSDARQSDAVTEKEVRNLNVNVSLPLH